MINIQTLIHSREGANTLIVMTGEQLRQLVDDITKYTRRVVEEQYQPRYFTVEQMTELFDCQTSTIYNWVKKGKIKAYKLEENGRTYFDQAEVRDAVRQGVLGKFRR